MKDFIENNQDEMFENFPLGILYFDSGMKVTQANKAACEILGYPGSLMGMNLGEIKMNAFNENYEKIDYKNYPTFLALKTGKEQKNHVFGFKNENTTKWVKVSAYPKFYEDETNPYSVFTIIEDISEIKKANAELKRSHELLEMSQQLTKTGNFYIEYPSRKVHWSKGVYGITEINTENDDVKIEDYINLVHPDDVKLVQDKINEAKINKSDFQFEYRMITRSGNLKFILTIGKVLLDDESEVCGIFGVITDITETKQAYELLRISEAGYKNIVENSIDGITLVDEDGKIIRWNKAQEEITGIPRDEALGKTLWDLQFDVSLDFEKNDETYNMLKSFVQNVLKTGKFEGMGKYIDHNIRSKSGVTKIIQSIEYPIKTEKGFMIGGILRDITELKLIQNEKNKILEKLELANKELEYFVYAVSHDLQEPLRMIKSYSNLIQRKSADSLDENVKEMFEYVTEGAERMQQLIIGLLNYSRISTRAKEIEIVDSAEIFQSVLDDLHLKIAEENCTVEYENLPVLKAEPVQLRQLFQNLLQNAIKFKGEDPPQIFVSAEKQNSGWLFSVKDNGIGIDKKYHERIFEIFQRLHEREKYEGTGVGLTLCKKIVERHGGKIWVKSEPGKGSTFYFSIQEN